VANRAADAPAFYSASLPAFPPRHASCLPACLPARFALPLQSALNGYQLDKVHKFAATLFDEADRLAKVSEEYVEPEERVYTPSENLMVGNGGAKQCGRVFVDSARACQSVCRFHFLRCLTRISAAPVVAGKGPCAQLSGPPTATAVAMKSRCRSSLTCCCPPAPLPSLHFPGTGLAERQAGAGPVCATVRR
jgi:hypothetical protein